VASPARTQSICVFKCVSGSSPILSQEQRRDSLVGIISAAQAMDTPVNASFVSPLANANLKIPISSGDGGFLAAIYDGSNAWTVALTLLLTLVAYDQCALHASISPNLVPILTDRGQSNTYG
jgi:hypothetical protein